uniref:Uncharacterized protein n=1 Tax=Rhodnius prolixus TaxID=13249 RepID=T1HEG2_RHOPR
MKCTNNAVMLNNLAISGNLYQCMNTYSIQSFLNEYILTGVITLNNLNIEELTSYNILYSTDNLVSIILLISNEDFIEDEDEIVDEYSEDCLQDDLAEDMIDEEYFIDDMGDDDSEEDSFL